MNVANNLIRFHLVITRGIDVAKSNAANFLREGFPDAQTRQGYLDYVHCLAVLLHGHHTSEDEFAFPCFKLKLPGAPLDQLIAEHREMQPVIARLDAAVERMRSGANGALVDLHGALLDLDALWHPHIGVEENHFSCQALAAALRPEEHAELGKTMAEHGQAHSQPHELTLPFVLFNLEPDERAEMMKLLPPVITEQLVPIVWKEKWSPMQPFLLN